MAIGRKALSLPNMRSIALRFRYIPVENQGRQPPAHARSHRSPASRRPAPCRACLLAGGSDRANCSSVSQTVLKIMTCRGGCPVMRQGAQDCLRVPHFHFFSGSLGPSAYTSKHQQATADRCARLPIQAASGSSLSTGAQNASLLAKAAPQSSG